jgi:hypothetical protein
MRPMQCQYFIGAGRRNVPDNFDVTVGMAVWDEELWRNFEGSMKGRCGTTALSKRSSGRTRRIGKVTAAKAVSIHSGIGPLDTRVPRVKRGTLAVRNVLRHAMVQLHVLVSLVIPLSAHDEESRRSATPRFAPRIKSGAWQTRLSRPRRSLLL